MATVGGSAARSRPSAAPDATLAAAVSLPSAAVPTTHAFARKERVEPRCPNAETTTERMGVWMTQRVPAGTTVEGMGAGMTPACPPAATPQSDFAQASWASATCGAATAPGRARPRKARNSGRTAAAASAARSRP
jgi:hypothetical protein